MKKFALTAIALAMFSGASVAKVDPSNVYKLERKGETVYLQNVDADKGIYNVYTKDVDGNYVAQGYTALDKNLEVTHMGSGEVTTLKKNENAENINNAINQSMGNGDSVGPRPNRPQPGTGAENPTLPELDDGTPERPFPGTGVAPERPFPGQGEGSVERPQPGQGVTPPRPQGPTPEQAIGALGNAFEQRVDLVNDYLSQAGNAIQNNANAINGLQGAFEQQAAHTGREIARLDGRIDALEANQNKLKAGIASATAIATLSQHVGAGNHNIAVAVGGYDGESAVAAGYTYIFDDRRTSFRATISTDSESEVAMGASIGHSW